MADFTEITLSGTVYQIPKNQSTPPWGEELYDYLLALGNAFSALIGEGDIPQTGFVLANNQAAPAPIVGLTFDTAAVRAADITYSIYRTTDLSTLKEAGSITVLYDTTATIGEKWTLQRDSVSDSLVDITIDDNGTISYTSNNQAGANYSGLMKFLAKAVLQS